MLPACRNGSDTVIFSLVRLTAAIAAVGGLCQLCASSADAAGAGRSSARPNIILMMADDLGWGDTGYNGHPDLKTPNLDAMAKAGLRFNRFYSGAPVCSPTRGSCLTGRHPYRYGIFFANSGQMRPPEVTLAELLREYGYISGHFGKWHVGTLTKTEDDSNRGGPRGAAHFAPPWENGFDQCFSTEAKVPTWDPLLRPKGDADRRWWDPVGDANDAVAYGTAYWANGQRVKEPLRGDDSRIIMDHATQFIRHASAQEKPFFAVVWFHAPHLPVVAGPQYTAPYAKFDKYHQHYFGCIAALDEQVGRLRAELRTLDVADNTLVFFCSDNGPEGNAKAPGSAGNLRGHKRSLFEGGVRVPGLAEWPAVIQPGSVTDTPASTSDYLPTILAVLGVESPDVRPRDGVSLLPLLRGEMSHRPRPIAFESRGQLSLVDNRYKIIHQPTGQNRKKKQSSESATARRFMLFDLQADPAETKDLAGEHPEIVRKMAATLASWQDSCRASLNGDDYR